MRELLRRSNPFGDDKVIDACAIFGVMDTLGKPFDGSLAIKALSCMHVRSNGLGGGFAVYGLYPGLKDYYAFHIMFETPQAKEDTERFIKENFFVFHSEEIPIRKTSAINHAPKVWRYFVSVDHKDEEIAEEDHIVAKVMEIDTKINGAFVFSSGRDMGVFKGVGYAEDIARYFRLEEYSGYIWLGHGRFPTNTPGWWGGAHPFNILDWTVVHNGELSSYGINRRFLEGYGYFCTMQTDTEVVAYAVDLLVRRHNLPWEIAAKVLAPPLWSQIEHMSPEEQTLYKTLRHVYGSLLLNGPFSVIIARHGEMIGLTDRIRLRPLTVGISKDKLFLSSEESAIRAACPDIEQTFIPHGGQPIIGRVKTKTPLKPAI